MHTRQVGRLLTALAEVQETMVESVGRLKRTTRWIAWSMRRSQENNQDPVLAMLASAPVDDEPVTDDDRRHIEEGRQAYRDGQVLSAEEVRRACLDARGDKDRVAADRTIAV